MQWWEMPSGFDLPSVDLSGLPDLAMELAGDLRLGGSFGFGASFSADFDPSAGELEISIEHEGGWDPLSALGSSLFVTPAFSGYLSLGGANKTYLNVRASVDFSSPIDVLSDYLTLSGADDPSAGPSIAVGLTQETKGGEYAFGVNMSGSVRIGGSNGFDATLRGGLDTGASSAHLSIVHLGGWSPLPGALASYFSTPAFEGYCGLNMPGPAAPPTDSEAPESRRRLSAASEAPPLPAQRIAAHSSAGSTEGITLVAGNMSTPLRDAHAPARRALASLLGSSGEEASHRRLGVCGRQHVEMDYSAATVTTTGTFTAHNQGRVNYGPIGTVNGEAFDLMVEPTKGGLPATFMAGITENGFPYLSLEVPRGKCDPSHCAFEISTAECQLPCTDTVVDLAHFDWTFVKSGTNQPMPPFGDFDLTFYDIDGSWTYWDGRLKEIVAVDGAVVV